MTPWDWESSVHKVPVVSCHGLGLVVHHVLLHLDSAEAGQLVDGSVAGDKEGDIGGDGLGDGEHVEAVHAAPHLLEVILLLPQVLQKTFIMNVNEQSEESGIVKCKMGKREVE